MEPDSSSPNEEGPLTPQEVQRAQEREQARGSAHILALLRHGMPVNTASLARAAAATVANEQIRTDGLQEQIGKLQVELKVLDRTVLKLSLQLFHFFRDAQKRRGLPDLPGFPLWLATLPSLEGRPHASLTRYLQEEQEAATK